MPHHPPANSGTVLVPTLANPANRIDSLDLLRGLAILGIFLMNTWTMSLPQYAYTNPAIYNNTWIPGEGFPDGDYLNTPTGGEYWAYVFIHIFADMKFITTFSILFGAGIVLQSERAGRKGRNPWLTHYLRMVVLLMFGLAHSFGFWYGDILTDYAMCGILLAPCRRLPAWLLLPLGLILIGGVTAVDLLHLYHPRLPWDMTVGGVSLQPSDLLARIDGVSARFRQDFMVPGPEGYYDMNDYELRTYRGSWWQQVIGHRFATSLIAHTTGFVTWTFLRCGGCMLLGMALQKLRFFHGQWTLRGYAMVACLAIPIGWYITYRGILYNSSIGWSEQGYGITFNSFYHRGVTYNYYGSLIAAVGYLSCGVLLAWGAARAPWLSRALIPIRAVGRMALTCYLGESLIGTTIFYGHGFGQFGYLSRPGLLPIVFATWFFLLTFATIWLSYFRQGPLEWFWHTLVYREWRNPLKSAAGPDGVPAARNAV